MTISTLREKLRSMGIREDSYSLDEGDRNERYVLSRDASSWIVYYSERGLRTGLRTFSSLDEAGAHLCDELAGDALAKSGTPIQ